MRIALLSLVLLAPAYSEPQDSQPEWTLLLYVNADTNLELACITNLEAAIHAFNSDKVNVVVQIDRAEKDEPEGEGFTARGLGDLDNFWSTKRLVIRKGWVEELADLGETNSGDAKVLASFIAWGAKKFPAKRTAMIFMDHGGAWAGWGHDLSHKEDLLSVAELAAGLEAGRKAAGLGRFDVLAFESCLMASIEVMRACRPHAKLMAGSQEISYIGGGVYWQGIMQSISKSPDLDGPGLARLFVDQWKGFFENSQHERLQEMGKAFPLCVVDLDKFGAVLQAMDSLCDVLTPRLRQQGRAGWLPVANARHRSEEYGKLAAGGFHCHDLHHFVRGLPGIDRERDAVLQAIENAIVYRLPCAKRPEGRGISLLFPSTKEEFDLICKRVDYASIAASPKWMAFLQLYYEIQHSDTTAPITSKTESDKKVFKRGEQIRLTTTVKADDIAEGHFVLGWPSNDEVWLMGLYPVDLKKDPLDCEFDGTWLAIGDGKQNLWACVLSYEETERRQYIVGVPVYYTSPRAKTESEITLFFTVRFDENWKFVKGTYLYAFEYDENAPTQITLKQGATIVPLYYVLTEEGKTMEKRRSNYTLSVPGGGLKIAEIGLPEGTYTLGYQVTDLAGNETFDGLEIQLKP